MIRFKEKINTIRQSEPKASVEEEFAIRILMSISDIKEDKEVLTFVLKDADTSIANALRRTLLMDIESWAFGEIVLKKNKTPFIEEFLTDRVSLIPIYQKEVIEDSGSLPSFKLSVKGEVNDIITVYTKDLKASDGKKYFPDNILIAKLKGIKNTIEELEIEAKLERGMSKTHSKWAILTVCGYEERRRGEAERREENEEDDRAKRTRSASRRSRASEEYAIRRPEFKFMVEAREVQSPRKSVKQAFDVLVRNLESIKEDIKKGNEKKIKIDKVEDKYFVYLYQEGHTVGNLLSSHIQNKFKDIPFVAYEVPHLLEETVLITIVGMDPVEAINRSIDDLVKLFEKLKKAF